MSSLSPRQTSRSSIRVRQVKEELVCSICLDFLHEPILLSCAHSYCRRCLQDLIQTPSCDMDANETDAVQCPNCRAVTEVPNNDVNSLPTNFKLKSLVDIVADRDRRETQSVLVDAWQLPLCSQHCRSQEYYCRDCSELLCRRCMMDLHRHHNYEEADAVLSEDLAALQSLIPPAWEAVTKAEGLVGKIAQRKETMSANAASVKANIAAFFDRARELLNEREQILLGTVEKYSTRQLKWLGGFEDNVHDDRITILETISCIEKLLESPRDAQSVLTERKVAAERMNTHWHSILTISESISSQEQDSILLFSDDQSLCAPITELGTLVTDNTEHANLEPSKLSAISSPDKITPMQKTSAAHQADGSFPQGTDYETGQSAIPSCSTQVAARGAEKTTKQVRSRYRPSLAKHMRELSLPVLPRMIQNEPPKRRFSGHPQCSPQGCFQSATKKPKRVIMCHKGRTHDDIHPCGIAVGHSDSIVVSDLHSHSVKVLASNGKVIDTVGGEGKNSGQFRGPCALAIDREQNIYILERENRRIQKFSNGTFTTWSIGQKGGKLRDPWGIAVSDEKVFITDWQQNCIHILDRNGKHISCIGASESNDFLKLPAGIAVTSEGHLLVADQENHCIWKMTQDGRIIRPIGYKGDKPGQLNSPYSIAVDTNGLVIVTESGNSRVSVFSQQGEFQMCFGGRGSEEGRFNQPRHVSVNSKGQIVVADEMNQRIQIFEL